MKRFVCLICACWGFLCGQSQSSTLSIAKDKTTSLIFPFAILHVDRGTKDVLVQQVPDADNILLVKAAVENFVETNLSVVTGDGSVYSFIVNFDKHSKAWVHRLPVNKDETIATYANNLLDNSRTMRGIQDRSWDVMAAVNGIYIKENVIYYQIKISNPGPLNFDIDLIRFFIKDKKKSKRTAVQENELKPLHISGNISQVKAINENTIVAALEKFTIPDAKYLAIQIMEKNGGRHLDLKVTNRKLIKGKILADLR